MNPSTYDDNTGMGGGGMQGVPGQGPVSPNMMAQGQQFMGVGGNTGPGATLAAPQGRGVWGQLQGAGQGLGSLADKNNQLLAQNFSAVQSGMPVQGFGDLEKSLHPAQAQALSNNPAYNTGVNHGIQGVLDLFKKVHTALQKGSGSGAQAGASQADQSIASMNPTDLMSLGDSESQ